MRSKRSADLSMNIVVIAILALLILIILAILFMGGIGNVSQRIKNILNIGTQGKDVELAQEQCRLACIGAQAMTSDIAKAGSAYCKSKYDIDLDSSGTMDENEIDLPCNSYAIGISCIGVTC